MENQYYSKEECLGALQRATDNINQLTNACKEYTRGVNDCFALLANYDLELRGKSKARDYIDFQWNKPREFAVKLKRIKGYTVSDYLIYCGCKIITDHRPRLGDVAFHDGAMINGGDFWVSTNENNTGVHKTIQAHFLKRRLSVIARPIRS